MLHPPKPFATISTPYTDEYSHLPHNHHRHRHSASSSYICIHVAVDRPTSFSHPSTPQKEKKEKKGGSLCPFHCFQLHACMPTLQRGEGVCVWVCVSMDPDRSTQIHDGWRVAGKRGSGSRWDGNGTIWNRHCGRSVGQKKYSIMVRSRRRAEIDAHYL